MKRTLFSLALAAAALVGLSACTTTPPAERAPVVSQTTVDLMLSVRAKELELERIDKMAMLKFAAESNSDLVKGAVMGMIMGKGGGASGGGGGGSSTTQTIMQAQAQADSVALRREEMAYANSFDKRLLPYVSLGLDVWRFDRNLSFQKWSIGESNTQSRYLFDTLRGTQQDGYGFSGAAYSAGSAATLGGVSAGASAASAGAAAVAGAAAPAASETTAATTE